MAATTTAFLKVASKKAKDATSGQMVASTLGPGATMRCQALAASNGQMAAISRAFSRTELCTEKATMCGRMGADMTGITDSIRSTDLELTHTLTGASTGVSGSMACNMALAALLTRIAHTNERVSGPKES